MPRTSADQAKHALRRAVRSQRGGRDRTADDAGRLADLVLGVAGDGLEPLAAYVSLPAEPPTGELLGRCRSQRRVVLLPVLLPDLDLDWARDDGTYQPGGAAHGAPGSRPAQGSGPAQESGAGPAQRSGPMEPGTPRLGTWAVASASLVVVPALAVDRRGVRLGQGGGSYDRALARVPGSTPVVALLHPGELVDVLPRAAHDRPVDAVITVDGVLWL
jgi:5-formyltetrahydrofolate cyclo-ligase